MLDIYAYTEETWGEPRAVSYLYGLYEIFDHIGRHPLMGRLRPELGEAMRSFPHGAHVIFFMPWQGEVAIVRVLHGAVDFDSLFGAYDPMPGIETRKP